MWIYSNQCDCLYFSTPYNGKRLLHDSVERTVAGWNSLIEGKILNAVGNILLARIESVAATVFVALSEVVFVGLSVFLTPLFLIPATLLNIASRIPGLSSLESVQQFTSESSDVIWRVLKVHVVVIPSVFTFLTASTLNIFLPGLLGVQNVFFDAIDMLIESLGPLKTITATVAGIGDFTGVQYDNFSILEGAEEYGRALSFKNYLRTVNTAQVTYHYTYTQ